MSVLLVALVSHARIERIAMTRAFDLTTAERAELTRLRDTAPQAYLRERAAALVKVADGMSAARVARQGLLRPRKPDTVYAWRDRWLTDAVGTRAQARFFPLGTTRLRRPRRSCATWSAAIPARVGSPAPAGP